MKISREIDIKSNMKRDKMNIIKMMKDDRFEDESIKLDDIKRFIDINEIIENKDYFILKVSEEDRLILEENYFGYKILINDKFEIDYLI